MGVDPQIIRLATEHVEAHEREQERAALQARSPFHVNPGTSCAACGFVVDGGGSLEQVVCLRCLQHLYNPLTYAFIRQAFDWAQDVSESTPAYLPFPHLRVDVLLGIPDHQAAYLLRNRRPYQATAETTCIHCGALMSTMTPLLLQVTPKRVRRSSKARTVRATPTP